jgi:predicted DNA-binding protein (UPF0251 family)
MARPRKNCRVSVDPRVDYFKPRGIRLSELKHIALEVDELEALRLADYVGLTHEKAGNLMRISRPTFGRIVERARQKVADALLHGKAIQITKRILIDRENSR